MGQVMDSIKQNTEENISSLDIPPMVLEEEHDNVDPEFQFTIPRCTSPTPDLKCTGDFECCDSPTMKATVVSLSACNDWEIVWDTPGQYTMTKALIEVLKEDSQPVLDVLVKKVAIDFTNIERRTRQLEARSRVESDPSEFVGDEVNFWTPQVGSLKRVKMTEDHFVL
ncbi:hypothetical protein QCA50_011362 [Cerrena zonata]|uniref:Uncharacterized protein n=1 Tax=Cerrena zonata TaxID=2478898 RepID=A0AAW0FWS8_9APHY